MEVSATARYIRISPRKMLLLAMAIKKMKADQAIAVLRHTNKHGAKDLQKLVLSAVANARVKNVLDAGSMHFKFVDVTSGPAMKRFRAVSRGTAHSYKKRMTHISLMLTDERLKETEKAGKASVLKAKKIDVPVQKKEEVKGNL